LLELEEGIEDGVGSSDGKDSSLGWDSEVPDGLAVAVALAVALALEVGLAVELGLAVEDEVDVRVSVLAEVRERRVEGVRGGVLERGRVEEGQAEGQKDLDGEGVSVLLLLTVPMKARAMERKSRPSGGAVSTLVKKEEGKVEAEYPDPNSILHSALEVRT